MKPNPTLNCAFVLCLLPVAFTAKGQYYPGGLGNGKLILWLDAKNSGSITKNAFNQVSAWADGSGNGFNFSQATLANSPVYDAAVIDQVVRGSVRAASAEVRIFFLTLVVG